ncbi:MAG TPA: hypothetical protein VFQ53_25720 [Kofleriaceae bacterium]|nr:hypothetical protein [Kofleriaceae bacterium]
MKLGRLACVLALALTIGCGPSKTGGDDDDQPTTDADGDGISDVDEGAAANLDTDGDGTPDFEDDDSDADGIPDYREAGDADPATNPVDSDGDGTPDFQDLDSDANGRPDSLDGVDDIDADNVGNWADLDDDGDAINDVDELGPNPAQPVDFDGDGTPDFRDTDSDNDTITDYFETAQDFDADGTPNFHDLESDGDCVPDQLEAGGVTPPRDSDADARFDFLDRDSDNDGLLDGAEDANCNGVRDGAESSATNPDTDGDGVTDLVEDVANTDPNNPNSNPQANGDYVFVEPYMAPQTPTDDDLDFKTNLQAVDMYVLLDRSGSMSTEISTVKSNLSTVVRNLTCAPLGGGTPPNCIPDLWAGAGTIGYHGSGADAYRHFADIQPNPAFGGLPITEPTSFSDTQEPLTFASYAAVTGQGGASFTMSAVGPRTTCVGSPAANAGFGTFGYPCFRQGALPVVLLATDEPPLSSGDTFKLPDWNTIVKPQYQSTKARLVGILGSAFGANTDVDLRKMATDSGAVDAANNNAPLVFDGAGANAASAIQTGILRLANGLPLDLNAVTADDPSDAINAVTSFVDHIETLQLGTAQCANGLTDVDTNSDTFKDKFVQVRTGTPVCWKVFSKQNTTVPATDTPQLFRATVTVFGDGITQLDQRDVFFLVPPAPNDGPIQ